MDSPYRLKETLAGAAIEAGAVRVGFARADDGVTHSAMELYDSWIATEKNAAMAYMANHRPLRANPLHLLELLGEGQELLPREGTVIVAAFSYWWPEEPRGDVRLAMYARGDDYHEILRRRLQPLADILVDSGFRARICVDSAPVMEKYWAVRAGVGFIGRNSLLITPEAGSYVFLAEIITDAVLPEGCFPSPCVASEGMANTHIGCMGCGACVRRCPGGAINPDGTIDANRCLSYLTIEHRGEWSPRQEAIVRRGDRRVIYGCDICQQVCPHNHLSDKPEALAIGPLRLRGELSALTRSQVETLTPGEFSRLFARSAVKRAKLAGLLRNARRDNPDR